MLRVTQLNVSGFTAPSDFVVEPEDPLESNLTLPSAYEIIDDFSVDITFEGMYPNEVITTDPLTGDTSTTITYDYSFATNVTSSFNWSEIGLTFSKPNAYTVRLSGPGIDVFLDQYYRFVLPDLTESILPPDTTVPFYSLTKYNKPAANYVMKTYPFVVTRPVSYGGTPTENENVSMDQWFYWRYQVAVANIASIRSRSLK